MLIYYRNQERETNLMSGRHSFSELTKAFTQERRRRIAEMKAEVLSDMSRDYTGIITIEPGKRSGKPCVRGMRVTVDDVLEYLASGMTETEVLADSPYLTHEDIEACRAFDADRKMRIASTKVLPNSSYCLT